MTHGDFTDVFYSVDVAGLSLSLQCRYDTNLCQGADTFISLS